VLGFGGKGRDIKLRGQGWSCFLEMAREAHSIPHFGWERTALRKNGQSRSTKEDELSQKPHRRMMRRHREGNKWCLDLALVSAYQPMADFSGGVLLSWLPKKNKFLPGYGHYAGNRRLATPSGLLSHFRQISTYQPLTKTRNFRQ